jgi:hypothetical protein
MKLCLPEETFMNKGRGVTLPSRGGILGNKRKDEEVHQPPFPGGKTT